VSSSALDGARGAAQFFDVGGRVVDVQPYGSGLINATFLVRSDAPGSVILQRINRRVFPSPHQIQANLRTLLDHSQASFQSRSSLQVPEIIRTRDGADFHLDGDGEFWRAAAFLESTRSVDAIEDVAQAQEIGWALGRFHAMLSDLEPDRLYDTLPGFHVTPGYLSRLEAAVNRAKLEACDAEFDACLAFVAARRGIVGVLEDAKRHGLLRERVIHGDPKINNVLFAEDSGRAVAMIDLDTVKPGLVHYDLGDCLRSVCNRGGEGGAEEVSFDLELCARVLSGYFSEARAFLTPQDVSHLYDAIRLIPFELGLRFLTDHIDGDVYFRVRHRGENLHRALVQFSLVASIEQREEAIRALCEGNGLRTT
jgi:Ser/Thr protein kinase RdoA (MazF antagonist)